MSLIRNGKSDVRNHFSTHRKSNLHLVATEDQPVVVDESQEQIEVATTSAAVGSPVSPVPTSADGPPTSETMKS